MRSPAYQDFQSEFEAIHPPPSTNSSFSNGSLRVSESRIDLPRATRSPAYQGLQSEFEVIHLHLRIQASQTFSYVFQNRRIDFTQKRCVLRLTKAFNQIMKRFTLHLRRIQASTFRYVFQNQGIDFITMRSPAYQDLQSNHEAIHPAPPIQAFKRSATFSESRIDFTQKRCVLRLAKTFNQIMKRFTLHLWRSQASQAVSCCYVSVWIGMGVVRERANIRWIPVCVWIKKW